MLFQKRSKMQKLESNLAKLKARAALLVDERIRAQAALDAAKNARQIFMLEGDLSDEKTRWKLQGSVDTCTSALTGVIESIATQDNLIVDAEQQLTAESYAVACVAASEKVTTDVDVVERLVSPWLKATRELAGSLQSLDHVHEAGAISAHLTNFAGDVEIATAIVIPQLRNLAQAIADGNAPIPRAPEQFVPVVEPAPTVQLFVVAVDGVKWIDAEGKPQLGGRFSHVFLTESAAARALKIGACVKLSDPQRVAHDNRSPVGIPDPTTAIDLDDSNRIEPMVAVVPFVRPGRGPFTISYKEPVAL